MLLPNKVRPPLASTVSELLSSTKDLIRSELELTKAELKESSTQVTKKAVKLSFFAVMGFLSILPFLAFLIIGLGALLNANYWLSSLIVSVVFLATGGLFGFLAFKQLKEQDLTLPQTRQTLNQDIRLFKRKAERVKSSDSSHRRAA